MTRAHALTLAALALVGCGGRIDSDGDGASRAPLACSHLENGFRGSYIADDGGIAYACCGYADADLVVLAEGGDLPAAKCLGR